MNHARLLWHSICDLLSRPFRPDGIVGALFSTEPSVPGDDPTLQQLLMLSAVFCGPVMFFIGGMLFWVIPSEHWSFWNAFLSMVTAVWLIVTTSNTVDRASRIASVRSQSPAEHLAKSVNVLRSADNEVVDHIRFHPENLVDFEPVMGNWQTANVTLGDGMAFEVLRSEGSSVLVQKAPGFMVTGGALVTVGWALNGEPDRSYVDRNVMCGEVTDLGYCSNATLNVEDLSKSNSFLLALACSASADLINKAPLLPLISADLLPQRKDFSVAKSYFQSNTLSELWCKTYLLAPDQASVFEIAFVDGRNILVKVMLATLPILLLITGISGAIQEKRGEPNKSFMSSDALDTRSIDNEFRHAPSNWMNLWRYFRQEQHLTEDQTKSLWLQFFTTTRHSIHSLFLSDLISWDKAQSINTHICRVVKLIIFLAIVVYLIAAIVHGLIPASNPGDWNEPYPVFHRGHDSPSRQSFSSRLSPFRPTLDLKSAPAGGHFTPPPSCTGNPSPSSCGQTSSPSTLSRQSLSPMYLPQDEASRTLERILRPIGMPTSFTPAPSAEALRTSSESLINPLDEPTSLNSQQDARRSTAPLRLSLTPHEAAQIEAIIKSLTIPSSIVSANVDQRSQPVPAAKSTNATSIRAPSHVPTNQRTSPFAPIPQLARVEPRTPSNADGQHRQLFTTGGSPTSDSTSLPRIAGEVMLSPEALRRANAQNKHAWFKAVSQWHNSR